MFLYNRINSEQLKSELQAEEFSRRTISFYRYFLLDQPGELRNQLYQDWQQLTCFGRIYIAREGINAQMSVPEHQMEAFFESLKKYPIFDNIPIKYPILEYARKIKQLDLPSNFIGKNFVFDERMGETVNGQVIAYCHQCGAPCDKHSNCANNFCHLLFIQCADCAKQFDHCCSNECFEVKNGTDTDKQNFRLKTQRIFGNRQVYRKSFDLAMRK